MSRVLRVASAQVSVGPDLSANTLTILGAIRASAEQGATLCVLPETALTGYSPMIGHGRPSSEWPQVQRALAQVAEAAAQQHIAVVVGSEAWADDAWCNRLYAFGDDGELQASYDKVHLTRDDWHYYRPGAGPEVFTLQGVRCGMQICYDARFPEGYRSLLHQGAELILQGFYGAGSGTWKIPVLGAHLRSRAAENGCFVVAANVAGPLQMVVSQIVDPLGLVLAAANQERAEIIVADLDLTRIDDSEIRADYAEHYRALPA